MEDKAHSPSQADAATVGKPQEEGDIVWRKKQTKGKETVWAGEVGYQPLSTSLFFLVVVDN